MELLSLLNQIFLILHFSICLSFASRLSINEETKDDVPPILPFDLAYPYLGDKLFLSDQTPQAIEFLQNIPKSKISDKYIDKGLIGKGVFGHVSKVDDNEGNTYALKSIKFVEKNAAKIANEIIITMGAINSPYLVRAYDVFLIEDCDNNDVNIGIVMDFIEGQDMVTFVNEIYENSSHGPNVFREEQAAKLAHDVLTGLLILHLQGVVHADVKPENIMYNMKTGDYVVVDYGISAEINRFDNPRGTPMYISPEIYKQVNGKCFFSPSMDIFSFGTTLLALLEPENPLWRFKDRNTVIINVLNGMIKPSGVRKYSAKLLNFLMRLLYMDRYKRDNVASFLDHPFLAETHFVPSLEKNNNEGLLNSVFSRFNALVSTRA